MEKDHDKLYCVWCQNSEYWLKMSYEKYPYCPICNNECWRCKATYSNFEDKDYNTTLFTYDYDPPDVVL